MAKAPRQTSAKRTTPPIDAFDKKLYELHKATLVQYYGKIEEVDLLELRRFVDFHTRAERIACELRGKETQLYDGGYRPSPLLAVLEKYEAIIDRIARKLGLNLSDRMAIIKAKRDQEQTEEKLKISKMKAETESLAVRAKTFDIEGGNNPGNLNPSMEGIEIP